MADQERLGQLGGWALGARYRAWSRLLHRFNLHHTRRIGPLVDNEGDGAYLIRCDWCGLSKTEPVDLYAKIGRASKAAPPEPPVGACGQSTGSVGRSERSGPSIASDDDLIEIRCLWQRTDYGHISLAAAARGCGGRKLGSYQDAITDEKFAKIRAHDAEVYPDWPLVESVVKVPKAAIEALFTDGTEIEAV